MMKLISRTFYSVGQRRERGKAVRAMNKIKSFITLSKYLIKSYDSIDMQEFLRKDFSKILKHNGLEARRLMKDSDSSVARIYDRNLEGLNITVDLYGPYARILDYGDEPLNEDELTEVFDLVRRFLYVESDKVVYRVRKKRPNGEQHERGEESLVVDVKENSHLFRVDLLKYVDTGLFLDQVNTRMSVEASSFGLKVLNLFSYTGSFSVYAASGGAESVESVDLSNVYTAWARENMDANGFLDRTKYPTIASDAEIFVENAVKEKRRWDLIIFDPPSFSNTHKAHDFDLKKDYLYYLYNFTKLLSDGGVVVFSENLASFNIDKNRLKAYYKIKEVTDELRAFGFTRKRNTLRIFRLEKVKEFKGEVMKRIMDDESLERLSLGEGEEKKERKPRQEVRRDRRSDYAREERRSYGIEKGSFKDRRSREYGSSDHERKPARRYSDDRYDERRSDKYKRDGFERDRRRDDYNDYPRRRYDEAPRRRDFDDRRPSSSRWDDKREYSERRGRRDDERPRRRDFEDRPRRREEGQRYQEERKPRVRKAPVPYGYDEFRKTKGRDDKKEE